MNCAQRGDLIYTLVSFNGLVKQTEKETPKAVDGTVEDYRSQYGGGGALEMIPRSCCSMSSSLGTSTDTAKPTLDCCYSIIKLAPYNTSRTPVDA